MAELRSTPQRPSRSGEAAPGRLELRGLTKSFPSSRRGREQTPAVDSLDLHLEPGSFTALLGPSGCGKSTTLSMVAGLLAPSAGDVLLDGRSLLGDPPERRPVSLVFQKPLLFGHLSVAANVGFGLRMARVPRPEIRRRVGEMLDRVRLGDLAGRRVDQLSGGQEQRVSLARALVLEPRVLLLDEPFSQLDAELRGEMRTLVRTLQEESGVTTLFVTHDQDEAVELADRVALLLGGSLAGLGSPEEFYTRPPTLAAARFFGVRNELPGRVRAGVFEGGGEVRIAAPEQEDGAAVLVVRPESIRLVEQPSRAEPTESRRHTVRLCASVTSARFAGTHLVVEARLGADAANGQEVSAHVPVGTRVAPGDPVVLILDPEHCTVLPTARPSDQATQERGQAG